MDMWRSIGGMVRVRLTSADPAQALMVITSEGIEIFGARREEEQIESEFSVRRRDWRRLKALAQRKGYELKPEGRSGLYWAAKGLLKRPVLTFGIVLLTALALYLPSRVLFIQVEGNSTVPTRLILEKCEASGIYFGASRRAVRSEKVKNALLEAIPELQWAGVNTSGCVAVITVRERPAEETGSIAAGVGSIVAARDGVITRCTVTRGTSLCRVGQAVRAGEMLVSGYTDCGICIRADRAEAEIYAQTYRTLEAIAPTQWSQDAQNGAAEKKYALIIGKKRINFYKGSGISGTTCDKMYSEYYVTLPGGFVLPVAIVTEVWTCADSSPMTVTQESAETVLRQFAARYLPEQMVAGAVMTAWDTVEAIDGAAVLRGNYACEEMIAQARSEEIVIPNGNDYGTDR